MNNRRAWMLLRAFLCPSTIKFHCLRFVDWMNRVKVYDVLLLSSSWLSKKGEAAWRRQTMIISRRFRIGIHFSSPPSQFSISCKWVEFEANINHRASHHIPIPIATLSITKDHEVFSLRFWAASTSRFQLALIFKQTKVKYKPWVQNSCFIILFAFEAILKSEVEFFFWEFGFVLLCSFNRHYCLELRHSRVTSYASANLIICSTSRICLLKVNVSTFN